MRKQQIKKLLKIMFLNGKRIERDFKNDFSAMFCENLKGLNVIARAKEALGLTEKGKLNTEYPISLFDNASFKTWKEGKK